MIPHPKPEFSGIERCAALRSWEAEIIVDGYYSVWLVFSDNGTLTIELQDSAGGSIVYFRVEKEKFLKER